MVLAALGCIWAVLFPRSLTFREPASGDTKITQGSQSVQTRRQKMIHTVVLESLPEIHENKGGYSQSDSVGNGTVNGWK